MKGGRQGAMGLGCAVELEGGGLAMSLGSRVGVQRSAQFSEALHPTSETRDLSATLI